MVDMVKVAEVVPMVSPVQAEEMGVVYQSRFDWFLESAYLEGLMIGLLCWGVVMVYLVLVHIRRGVKTDWKECFVLLVVSWAISVPLFWIIRG